MKSYELLLALSEEGPCSLEAVRLTLEDWGYQVTRAASNWAAIEALHTKDFDLVITNLLEVLKTAKQLRPHTIVVVLTSDYKIRSVIRALRLGADDCFIEPLDPSELRELAAYCSRKMEQKRTNSPFESRRERSDGEILNMLKIATHDINGSLLAIAATLKLLGRGHYGKVDEGVANSLKEVLSKTLSLIGVTEEYLGRTLLLDDDLGTKNEVLDLTQDIINPVLQELSAELKEHPILMDHRFEPAPHGGIPVKASRIGLKAVFRNLIRNAIKYGGKGCTISLALENHGGSYQLDVYNSGEPIPAEYRSKLFSKFIRLEGNGNGNGSHHGMGLGLYLTKKIIEKQGGTIWYEASENGSNFMFTLPSGLTLSTKPSLPVEPPQSHLASASI